MPRSVRCRLRWTTCTVASIAALTAGCGTTRSTDTLRTASEQLLISDAIDRAVQDVNFAALRGQTVFLDDQRLTDVVDRNYLISTLRQHLLASGCLLRDKRDDADFIVEARAGAVGTDRNDLLFGVPSMNVPQILPVQPVPAAIPEIPIAKRRDQRGIAKIAVFAYHRETGTPVWQSGLAHEESSANDVWILGAGPFQRGTIYDGTEFAGKELRNDMLPGPRLHDERVPISLARERIFTPPRAVAPPARLPSPEHGVLPAAHESNAPESTPAPAPLNEPENAKPIATAASRESSPATLPQPRFSSP